MAPIRAAQRVGEDLRGTGDRGALEGRRATPRPPRRRSPTGASGRRRRRRAAPRPTGPSPRRARARRRSCVSPRPSSSAISSADAPLERVRDDGVRRHAPEPVGVEPVDGGVDEGARLDPVGRVAELGSRLRDDRPRGLARQRRRSPARDPERVRPRVVGAEAEASSAGGRRRARTAPRPAPRRSPRAASARSVARARGAPRRPRTRRR